MEALVAELQAPWPLSLVRQEHLGFRLASIRNAAIRAARNEVIVNLDGDMIPLPGFLEAHMRWFHASDEVATVGYRRFVVMDGVEPVAIAHGDLNLMAIPEVRSASNWFIQGDRRLPEFAGFERHPAPYNLFHGCNVAYLRRDAMEVGLYDEEFNGHWGYEDNEFGYRLWRRGVRFVAEPTALALHQENSVVTFEDRVKGDEHNFEIACRKIPGFREFKKRLRDRGRRPWW